MPCPCPLPWLRTLMPLVADHVCAAPALVAPAGAAPSAVTARTAAPAEEASFSRRRMRWSLGPRRCGGRSEAVQPARGLGDRAAHRGVDREGLRQLVGSDRLGHRERDRV